MLPLSFSEFLTFHNFEIRETKSALGGTRKQAYDKMGEHYELREVFDAYMRFGGMPGIADIGLDPVSYTHLMLDLITGNIHVHTEFRYILLYLTAHFCCLI